MTLIKSISGIRGTIGGKPAEGLSPLDVVKFTAAYAAFVRLSRQKKSIRIVTGRDGRISGPMVSTLVNGALMGMGVEVIDGGLSTTPSVEMAVISRQADGGIIITASHNPGQWNALKLLNHRGEFLSAADGEEVLRLARDEAFEFVPAEQLGIILEDTRFIQDHIASILGLPLVDREAIRRRKFKVAIDCVNSTGGLALPPLLKELGVDDIVELYCEPTGLFPHNPEPLPENLVEISSRVRSSHADVGFAVDPDVDRLAIITEKGEMFGEEYTLVAVADYVLQARNGNTVSNLSSTRALRDITEKHGGIYAAAAVGEVNVVEKMKEVNAQIGGEGNGGVILPELHYGRDALVGIALFLSYLAKSGKSVSTLRAGYPDYYIAKHKIELSEGAEPEKVLAKIALRYKEYPINRVDGVKIEFEKEWVHLRKSNTEPIIRIYAESRLASRAEDLAGKIMEDIRKETARK